MAGNVSNCDRAKFAYFYRRQPKQGETLRLSTGKTPCCRLGFSTTAPQMHHEVVVVALLYGQLHIH